MTENSRPDTYRNQNGCHNCASVFVKGEYEEGPWYYCHIDKSERPLCMSVYMEECPDPLDVLEENPNLVITEEIRKETVRQRILLRKTWDDWSEPREVKPWGYCNKYVKARDV